MAGPLEDVRKAADQGNALAQAYLGATYAKGEGVPQDYAQALIWLRKAADQGNALAQAYLGATYAKGEGVPQDYAQALAWFRKAADQGNAYAQAGLGVMYAQGLGGVPQDYVQAYRWFNLAASRAEDPATHYRAAMRRDALADKMTPAQFADALRLPREWTLK